VERQSDMWALTIPIGTEAPISCIVFDKKIDGARGLVAFIRLIKERAKAGTAIQEIVPTDAGAIGETAYAMAALSYTTPSAKGLLGGLTKMMIRPDDDVPLLCFHDEVGYLATFKRVTQGLALSLKARQPTPPPAFVEIQVMRLGELPIGYERRTITTD